MSQELRDRVARYSDAELACELRQAEGDHPAIEFLPGVLHILEEEAEARGGKDALFARVDAPMQQARVLLQLSSHIREKFDAGDSAEAILLTLADEGLQGPLVTRLVHEVNRDYQERKRAVINTSRSNQFAILGGVIAVPIGAACFGLSGFSINAFVFIVAKVVFAIHFGLVYWLSGRKRTAIVGVVTITSIIAAALLGNWMHSHHILSGE